MDSVSASVEDMYLKEEISLLKEKLSITTPDCLARLYRLKCEKKLFTYPPIYLEMDETAYLCAERSIFYGDE